MMYLASPYSGTPDEQDFRHQQAMQCNSTLLNLGVYAYSPIVHCHEMAKHFSMPTDFEFWKGFNLHMISNSDVVAFLLVDGLNNSKGCKGEYTEARRMRKLVTFVTLDGYFKDEMEVPAQWLA